MTDKILSPSATGENKILPLNADRDAARWAREFNEVLHAVYRQPPLDEGWLIGWFANAMMCGEDTYRWRKEAEARLASTAIQCTCYGNAPQCEWEKCRVDRVCQFQALPSETVAPDMKAWVGAEEYNRVVHELAEAKVLLHNQAQAVIAMNNALPSATATRTGTADTTSSLGLAQPSDKSGSAWPRSDAVLAHLNLPNGTKIGVPTIVTELLHSLERELGLVKVERDALASAIGANDAECWRLLFGCSRIRVLGYARGGPKGRDGNIRHIGFEFTVDQEPYCATELQDGKDKLLEFIDALREYVNDERSKA